jgi:hypothetical protein
MAARRLSLSLPRRALLGLLTATGVVVFAGCEPGMAPATPTPAISAEELLAQASQRLGEVPTVHFVLDVEGDTYIDTAQTIRLLGAEGDLQRPDRVRTTFQAEVMGRAITLQLITVGERSWTTNLLTGEWGDAPFEFAYQPDILFSTQDGIGPVMGRVNDVTRLPDEELDGHPVHRLQATVDEEVVGPLTYYTISGSPVTVHLWIDVESRDLLRARLSEPPGEERPNPAVWILSLSHHGEPLTIEPPT